METAATFLSKLPCVSEKPETCAVYERTKLVPGYEVVGPAIVQEYASTIVLFPGDRATVSETGELLITIEGWDHDLT